MKYWNMAERVTGAKSTLATLASVLCVADENGVMLHATDLKNTVRLKAEGVEIMEPGKAIIPLKVVGELFKKISSSPLVLEVTDEKGAIKAGRSRYSFTTYPVSDFPELPSPRSAEFFAKAPAGELARVIEEGSIAGAPTAEFPKYLRGALLQVCDGEMRVVATDGRRLSLSKTVVEKEEALKEVLLPLTSLGEYQRILQNFPAEQEVEILKDGAVTYFNVPGVEYSVRRIDSTFPAYDKILMSGSTTQMAVSRQEFLQALDRINIVVRDSSRAVILKLSPGAALTLQGRAPEIGEALEDVDATVNGEPLKVAFNVGYLIGGLKAFHGDEVALSFNGAEGQMTIVRPGGADFTYMLMPIKVKSLDMAGSED